MKNKITPISQTTEIRRSFLKRLGGLFIASNFSIFSSSCALAQNLTDGLKNIKGRIINRGDPNYNLWRGSMIWYKFKPNRYPDTIIQAQSEQDVIDAVNYARTNGLMISVRSAGHNPAKAVLREGGILLDISPLQKVEVDTATNTAWVQPGIRSEELNEATLEHGLVFPSAHTGLVGLGGYLLGGGNGWNMGELDLASRSILAAEIILADGKKVIASANDNKELHWAIRGVGPGFFGVAVRYKLQLYPVHPVTVLNHYIVPIDKLSSGINELDEIRDKKDRRLEVIGKVGRFHPRNKPYTERDLVFEVSIFAFADSEDDAKNVMLPVTQSQLSEISVAKREGIHLSHMQLFTPPPTDYSSPNRTNVENIWLDDPGKGMMMLAEQMQKTPPASLRTWILAAWGINPVKEDNTSCLQTNAESILSWYVIAEKEDDIDSNNEWMDEAVANVQPLANGRYINEIDPHRYPHHVQQCFSEASWKRLVQLRKKYDPKSVFYTYLGHV